MSNKKKRNAPHNLQNLQQKLNPIITIDESKGESLFMIVDFSLPKWNHVRRIMSKRTRGASLRCLSNTAQATRTST